MAEQNKMLIDATHPEETRVVVLRSGRVEEFDYESAARKQLRGNIYLAKVTRVEPSLQAADLMGLDAFHFVMRPFASGQVIRPVSGRTLPLDSGHDQAEHLRTLSRDRFGVERREVEAGCEARLGGRTVGPPVGRRRKEAS